MCDDVYFEIFIDLVLYLGSIGIIVCDKFGFDMFLALGMTIGLLRMD